MLYIQGYILAISVVSLNETMDNGVKRILDFDIHMGKIVLGTIQSYSCSLPVYTAQLGTPSPQNFSDNTSW